MRARVIFHDHVFVGSKCTHTRDGKRKGETECRTKESAEEGTKAEDKGNISNHPGSYFSLLDISTKVTVRIND